MARVTILAPRGVEADAVRRARTAARVVEMLPGAASASALPDFDADETVIVMGLCGSLWRLKTGEVGIYGRVVDTNGVLDLDHGLVDEFTGALPNATVVNAFTAKRVITTVVARTVLAQRFNADVVDMEGTHLAAALSARGVRFAMVRVVSDDASRDLPPIDDAIDVNGRIQPVPVALAFARAPLAAFAFVRDVRSSLGVLTETARTINLVAV
jgi:adenosylhomocysteine nucleosidase